MYKIVNRIGKVSVNQMFPLLEHSRIRGHSCRVSGGVQNRDKEKLLLTEGCESTELTAPECSGCRINQWIQERYRLNI